MKKIIYNITKFTTTDYKDHLSCIVWFTSCNMRCEYCYNPDIVNSKSGLYTIDDLLGFLKKRVGLLEAVVLSGGEATMHNLIEICKEIKALDYKIKLDTNGSNPKQIKELLEKELLDFVAIDFKATKNKFKEITKSNLYDNFIESLNILEKSGIEYEVRTTLHNDLLNVHDINEMQDILIENNYKKDYFVQNFLEVENIGDLKSSTQKFDFSKLDNKLNIIWRN
ncbi:MAG: anaerobic ribonucleoside-triphosphate reductase activating protein [Halarcobacter sp.]